MLEVQGKVFQFGDNIDTDQIYPGRFLELTKPNEIASHAMEGLDSEFNSKVEQGDIVVAGDNFGCGSSREHAVIALKNCGIDLIIAESFARIFFRNCLNLALPASICEEVNNHVNEGNELKVDIEKGQIHNLTTNETLNAKKMSEYALKILKAGGIKSLVKNELIN